MKKEYSKPHMHISVLDIETDMLKASAPVVGGETDSPLSKDREDFGGEDSSWGDLW